MSSGVWLGVNSDKAQHTKDCKWTSSQEKSQSLTNCRWLSVTQQLWTVKTAFKQVTAVKVALYHLRAVPLTTEFFTSWVKREKVSRRVSHCKLLFNCIRPTDVYTPLTCLKKIYTFRRIYPLHVNGVKTYSQTAIRRYDLKSIKTRCPTVRNPHTAYQ